jgi:long-subunit acyl-CoA synthetase (AMP-forming)
MSVKNLKFFLKNYLNENDQKIAISDSENIYDIKQFKKKVLSYKKILTKKWNKKKSTKGLAILLERNVDYLALIFACWLSNGFYVPLSKDTILSNRKYQLKVSNADILAYSKNGEIAFKYLKIKKINKIIKKNRGKIAYIIFTSGSTGQKKGVVISNKNLLSYIGGINKIFKNKFNHKSVLINGELTFDISVADLVFGILFKTEIGITSNSRNLISLFSMIEKRKIESIYVVPSTLKKIIQFANKYKDFKINSLKQINCGGEILEQKNVREIQKLIKNVDIYNFYGPTEFTINSFFHKIKKKFNYNKNIPIGKPIPGIKFILEKKTGLDEQELFLSGAQLMLGYINSKSPNIKVNNKIFYPTGDIVSIDKKKDVYFEGRSKNYIKILGYRVNLNRIEKIFKKRLSLNTRAIANNNGIFIFLENAKKIKNIIKKAKKISEKNLESYERPKKIFQLATFPLGSTGKVNNLALRHYID